MQKKPASDYGASRLCSALQPTTRLRVSCRLKYYAHGTAIAFVCQRVVAGAAVLAAGRFGGGPGMAVVAFGRRWPSQGPDSARGLQEA